MDFIRTTPQTEFHQQFSVPLFKKRNSLVPLGVGVGGIVEVGESPVRSQKPKTFEKIEVGVENPNFLFHTQTETKKRKGTTEESFNSPKTPTKISTKGDSKGKKKVRFE